jgi:hypothetical protein
MLRVMGPKRRMQLILAIGAAALAFELLLFVAAPVMIGVAPTFDPRPWWEPWVPFAGLAIAIVGLGSMIRIYRGAFEPDPPAWRYRDRR